MRGQYSDGDAWRNLDDPYFYVGKGREGSHMNINYRGRIIFTLSSAVSSLVLKFVPTEGIQVAFTRGFLTTYNFPDADADAWAANSSKILAQTFFYSDAACTKTFTASSYQSAGTPIYIKINYSMAANTTYYIGFFPYAKQYNLRQNIGDTSYSSVFIKLPFSNIGEYIPTATTYTINYKPGTYGSGTAFSQSVSYGSKITLASNANFAHFTRTGYNSFSGYGETGGWTTKADGSDDGYGWANGWSGTWTYTSGQFGISGTTLTLYPRWVKNYVVIMYHPNGGTVGSSSYKVGTGDYPGMIATSGNSPYFHIAKYGTKPDPYNATTFGLTRSGYTFKGWALYNKSDGITNTILDQDTAYDSTKYYYYVDKDKNTTNATNYACFLYAVWEPTSAPIYINPNGGYYNNSTSAQTSTIKSGTTFYLSNPYRNGYKFIGWCKYNGQGKLANAMLGDSGFVNGMNGITAYDNGAGQGSGITITRSASGASSIASNIPTLSNAYLTITNKADYPYNPGIGGFKSYASTTAGHSYIIMFQAKLPIGYNFAYATNKIGLNHQYCWLTDNKGTGGWAIYAYQIDVGNSGSFETIGFQYVQGTTLPVTYYINCFEIYDITNWRWHTSVTTTSTDKTDLKAVWIQEKVEAQFNANSGSGTMSNEIIPTNTNTALIANKFTRFGYDFNYWLDQYSKIYQDKTTVKINNNLINNSANCGRFIISTSGQYGIARPRYSSNANSSTVTIQNITNAPVEGILSQVAYTAYNNGDNYRYIAFDLIPMKYSTNYTISCWGKGTGTLRFELGVAGKFATKNITLTSSTSWVRYSATFNSTTDFDLESKYMAANVYFAIGKSSSTCYLCGFKIEEGNTATPWTQTMQPMFNSGEYSGQSTSTYKYEPYKLTAQWKPAGVLKIYINGSWKTARPYIYVNGAWKMAELQTYSGGKWQKNKS